MSREIIQKEEVRYYCDYCQIEMEFDTVEVTFGYPSNFDMDTYQFCSDKCLAMWCIAKIKLQEDEE